MPRAAGPTRAGTGASPELSETAHSGCPSASGSQSRTLPGQPHWRSQPRLMLSGPVAVYDCVAVESMRYPNKTAPWQEQPAEIPPPQLLRRPLLGWQGSFPPGGYRWRRSPAICSSERAIWAGGRQAGLHGGESCRVRETASPGSARPAACRLPWHLTSDAPSVSRTPSSHAMLALAPVRSVLQSAVWFADYPWSGFQTRTALREIPHLGPSISVDWSVSAEPVFVWIHCLRRTFSCQTRPSSLASSARVEAADLQWPCWCRSTIRHRFPSLARHQSHVEIQTVPWVAAPLLTAL